MIFSPLRNLVSLSLLLLWSAPPLAALDLAAVKSSAVIGGAAAAPETGLTEPSVTEKRAALQKEISGTRAEFERLPAEKPGETAFWLTQEIALLARLDGIHGEQLRTLQHAADLAKEADEVAGSTKNPRPADVRLKSPYGLALLDQLYSERDYLLLSQTLLATDVDNATTALADARDELDASDRLRRAAKEAVAASANRAQAQGALRLAELESRLARETVALCEQALANLKLQQSLLAPKLALLLPDFEWLHAHLVLSDQESVDAKIRREKRVAELDATLETTRETAAKVARLVIEAERRAAGASTPADDELESRRADRQTLHLMLGALTAQRERQAVFAEVHDLRRRALSGGASPAEMKAWAATNNEALARLQKNRRPQVAELRKSRRELQDLRSRLADTAASPRPPAWMSDRVRHLSAWLVINERELADLSDLTTARGRLKEELGGHVRTFSWTDTLASTQATLLAAWNYEVFSVTDQPVRVKTILAVIALLFAGHWLSRRASALVGRAVFHRLGMNTGRRAAWQTLSFYALFLTVLLVALNLFHLSLTQFSVISGALAVGIGFGSQTLIGNFISGLILLVERPVNQGDVIEIDGHQMTVESIGPRSTLVRSRDNTHVIVPNSRLLEENVVNLTLSDDVIRTRINLGVAYGSPTREVARLLQEVLLGLEGVVKEPAPLVVFTEFGESALQFEASFWSALEGRKDLENEFRHRVIEAFAKGGIIMAFPQRDVHLATNQPLQIQLLHDKPPASTHAKA